MTNVEGMIVGGVIALLVIGLIVGGFALTSLLVWLLWNAVVHGICGGPSISFVSGILVTLALSIVGGFFKGRAG